MITYKVTVNIDGDIEWYLNGKRHREDGPAVEWADGYKAWFINDKVHREDGPAVESDCGNKCWFLVGERLTEEEFNNRMNPRVTELTISEVAAKLNIPLDQLRIKE